MVAKKRQSRNTMLGLHFPLLLLAAVQIMFALLLIGPLALAKPAISLAKYSKTPVGAGIFYTVSGFLLVLVVPVVLEVRHAGRDAEHNSLFFGTLTVLCFVLNFVLQRLGLVLSERESLKVSQGALLKQVQGLHKEYERVSQQVSKQEGLSDADLSKLKDRNEGLEREVQQLKSRAAEAQKSEKSALANMDALKSQTKGLENEYDRLLEENSRLGRRLAQADPSFRGFLGGDKKGS